MTPVPVLFKITATVCNPVTPVDAPSKLGNHIYVDLFGNISQVFSLLTIDPNSLTVNESFSPNRSVPGIALSQRPYEFNAF